MTKALSVNDAAELMGVCTRTVYNLCAAGKLKHFRVGRAIRIRPSAIEEFQNPESEDSFDMSHHFNRSPSSERPSSGRLAS